MRAVLYTPHLEPITVLQLKPWAVQYLREQRTVVLAVMEPFRDSLSRDLPMSEELRTVTIRAETLRYHSVEAMMLITRDEESALLLESAFLPGQHRRAHEVRAEGRAKGFAEGFLAAVDMLGRG